MTKMVLWLSLLLLIGGCSVAILWQSLNLLLNGELTWDKAPLPLVAAVVLIAVAMVLMRTVERMSRHDESDKARGTPFGGS
jgi:uncharacterized membrane protein